MNVKYSSRDMARYAPCPKCSAINMIHRRDCYRCRTRLNGEAGAPPKSAIHRNRYCEGARSTPNHRRLDRKNVSISNVRVEGEVVTQHKGVVLDVTPFGLCLRTAVPSRVGARLNMSILIGGSTHRLIGFIKHCQESEKDGSPIYTYGVQLEAPGYEARSAIVGL